MKVLYISKAMVVPAYRDKLAELARRVELTAIVPDAWPGIENGMRAVFPVEARPVWLSGHNHFHLYRDADAIIRRHAPDLVHIDEEPYSAVTFQLARVCRHQKVPALFFAWQNIQKTLPPPFPQLRSFVFRNVRGAIAGTEEAGRVLRAQGYAGSMAVIPQMGVSEQRFAPDAHARAQTRSRMGIGANELVVGYAGRLVRAKGVHVLVAAAARTPGIRLAIAGTGPEAQALRAQVHAAGMAPRVHFEGAVGSQDMPQFLNACDIVVLPTTGNATWKEQFGRVLVEAMSCGVPVIGSSNGEIPHVVGNAGVIVSAGDSAGLSAAIMSLSVSSEKRRALGDAGRARVAELFTNERIATQTADYYETVVRARVAA